MRWRFREPARWAWSNAWPFSGGAWNQYVLLPALAARPARLPGWVRSWQLGPVSKLKIAQAVVTARSATLANGTEVGFGSEVFVGQVPRPRRGRCRALVLISSGRRSSFSACTTSGGALGVGLRLLGTDLGGLPHARDHHPARRRCAVRRRHAGSALAASSPGDLLFYESPVVGHVSMAIGRGLMIEAPNSRSEVRIVPIRRRLPRRAPVLLIRPACRTLSRSSCSRRSGCSTTMDICPRTATRATCCRSRSAGSRPSRRSGDGSCRPGSSAPRSASRSGASLSGTTGGTCSRSSSSASCSSAPPRA